MYMKTTSTEKSELPGDRSALPDDVLTLKAMIGELLDVPDELFINFFKYF